MLLTRTAPTKTLTWPTVSYKELQGITGDNCTYKGKNQLDKVAIIVLPLKAARPDSINKLRFLGLWIWAADKPNTVLSRCGAPKTHADTHRVRRDSSTKEVISSWLGAKYALRNYYAECYTVLVGLWSEQMRSERIFQKAAFTACRFGYCSTRMIVATIRVGIFSTQMQLTITSQAFRGASVCVGVRYLYWRVLVAYNHSTHRTVDEDFSRTESQGEGQWLKIGHSSVFTSCGSLRWRHVSDWAHSKYSHVVSYLRCQKATQRRRA